MRQSIFVCAAIILLPSQQAFSQDLIGENLILSGSITQDSLFDNNVFNAPLNVFAGRACIGGTCDGTEVFDQGPLRLKWGEPHLYFEDSSDTAGVSSNDWRITVNEGVDTLFSIQDMTAGTTPFAIEGAVPTHTLYLDETGKVGIGTMFPERELHLSSLASTRIRFETSGTGRPWDIGVGAGDFLFHDVFHDEFPFTIKRGSGQGALYISETGSIGMGTETPTGGLELSTSEAFNFFRITATGAAVNDSVDITFTGGPLGTGQLRYNIVDGDNQEMSLDADGNLVLDGTLTTAGPTCAAGCDRVLDAGYALLGIKERADMARAAGHLPALGPTLPHAPINVTEKLAGVINELEHAHLYIDQLHGDMAQMRADMTAMNARLRSVEAQ